MSYIPKKLGAGTGMKGTHGKYTGKTPPGQFVPKGGSGGGTSQAAKKGPKKGK
jgi:hypothetical protein